MLTRRILGSFLSATCGNCLGIPYIYMKSKDLLENSRRIGWTLSAPSCDMEMCFSAIKTIAKYGVCLERIAQSHCQTVNEIYTDLDWVTAECFGTPKSDAISDAISDDRYSAPQNFGSLCSNTLLTRLLPIIYAGIRWDEPTLLSQIEKYTLLTHNDAYVLDCAKIYGMCLWCILNGKNRLETWDCLMHSTVLTNRDSVIVSSYFERPICDGPNSTHIGLSLQLALYHYWHDTPYVAAVRSGILSGGATETHPAAIGALLGAAHSNRILPTAWRKELEPDISETHTWRTRLKSALAHLQTLAHNAVGPIPSSKLQAATHWHAHRIDNSIRLSFSPSLSKREKPSTEKRST